MSLVSPVFETQRGLGSQLSHKSLSGLQMTHHEYKSEPIRLIAHMQLPSILKWFFKAKVSVNLMRKNFLRQGRFESLETERKS